MADLLSLAQLYNIQFVYLLREFRALHVSCPDLHFAFDVKLWRGPSENLKQVFALKVRVSMFIVL